jgi:hypothetical protein
MAYTRLTDVVPVKTFAKIVEGKIIENSKFRQSGVVVADPRIQAKAASAGFETTLPFWNAPAGGEADTMSDDASVKSTPSKVTQGSMTARVLSRSKSFSAMDIADYASDSAAIDYAASQFARLWVSDEESVLLATLNGLIADNVANDSGDMRYVKSITTGTIAAANKMSGSLLIDARRQLGDVGSQLSFVVMHSDVVNNLRQLEGNAFVPASRTDIGFDTYYGYRIIETDNVGIDTTVASYPVYSSYFVAPGLFGYGSATVDKPLVDVRDELAGMGSGQDTILGRRRYLLHALGFTNKVAPTNGISQTNAELSAAATWDRVMARKMIPLVQIKTNG